jgi:hypothetical protein
MTMKFSSYVVSLAVLVTRDTLDHLRQLISIVANATIGSIPLESRVALSRITVGRTDAHYMNSNLAQLRKAEIDHEIPNATFCCE